MDKIQMVNLKSQYHNLKPLIDAAMEEVCESTAFINGPKVRQFAQNLEQYLGVKHVIPCANGTDALQIALMALGLKPGDEVITPSFTYVATVEVVALLGLTPVFVDVDRDSFTMSMDDLKSKITDKTKAIIPVHLYGQCANMEEVMKIAKDKSIPVIEDTAQAIGSDYTFADGTTKKAGTMGNVGTTSFFPSKNLGCYGDGGAMFTDDDALAEKLRMVANHGQSKRYVHDMVGCNSRLDSLQAAILDIKLPHLDGYNQARQRVANHYNQAFADMEGVITPHISSYSTHVYHQYTLILENADRDKVIAALAEAGIPAMIYYPIPCHEQKMFTDLGVTTGSLPNTDYLKTRVISLPIHTEMSDEELNYISDNFKKAVSGAV